MSQPWIELSVGEQTSSHLWNGPRMSVGGDQADIEVPSPGQAQLHLWSSPLKVVLNGKGPAPLLNGKAIQEAALDDGDTLQWGGAVLVVRAASAVLEELPASASTGKVAAGSGAEGAGGAAKVAGEQRAWRRVLAGLLVEQRLADKAATRRWQDAVIRGEFKADAAAEDLIGASRDKLDSPKVLERAGRLQRDLLMMPLQSGVRGAGRGARRAVRGGSAYLLANLLGLLAYTLIIASIALLLRAQRGTSFDALIDSILGTVGSLFGS